jgi:hypothetical protein
MYDYVIYVSVIEKNTLVEEGCGMAYLCIFSCIDKSMQ